LEAVPVDLDQFLDVEQVETDLEVYILLAEEIDLIGLLGISAGCQP
jgi:hypothetical protein